MNEFILEFEIKKAEMEALIRSFAPEMKGIESPIAEAMNYSLLAGGKRIRPLIIKEVFELFGGKNKKLCGPFMAAIEMIHTYSLIHDDLPAMDNDDFRRGRPTNHNVYGEAMAILAGDALLNFAYETAVKSFSFAEGLEDYRRVEEAIKILSANAGIFGMVTGQVLDMNLAIKEKSKENIEKMYELKTGALFRASFMIGAVLAGADSLKIEKMKETGEAVGLAFQLQDDILDVHGDEKVTGKSLSDEKNEKVTLYRLLGEEKALQLLEELSTKAKNYLEEEGRKNKDYDGFLLRLISFLQNRDR